MGCSIRDLEVISVGQCFYLPFTSDFRLKFQPSDGPADSAWTTIELVTFFFFLVKKTKATPRQPKSPREVKNQSAIIELVNCFFIERKRVEFYGEIAKRTCVPPLSLLSHLLVKFTEIKDEPRNKMQCHTTRRTHR